MNSRTQHFSMSSMRRVLITTVAIGACVGVLIERFAFSGQAEAAPRALAAALLVTLAAVEWFGRKTVGRALTAGLTVAFCLLVPFALDERANPTSLLVMLLTIPLTITLLYVDEPPVVLAASLAGAFAVLLTRERLFMSWADYFTFLASGVLVHGVAIFCSLSLARQRESERERDRHSTEHLHVVERRQAQVERMALVGQLAAGVAHEINNPLAFVSSNVSLVREHLEGGHQLVDERPEDVLAEAQEGLVRIRQIVADLKAFAREDTDGNRPVNLADVVQEALRLASVSMPPGVFVECTGLAGAPVVKANHRKLVQVVLNLLVNAGDALEQAKVKDPSVRLSVRRTPRGVAIDVRDNGGGVSPDAQSHLFEPFFTTKPPGKGTGLGLAMSRETLRTLGGDLCYASAEEGACFTMELVAHAPKTPNALPPLHSPAVAET